jgi:ADP-ribose pyrophosphatase YjhB (NUDIX family)
MVEPAEFLAGRVPEAEEAARWGSTSLRVESYLGDKMPPVELVTSVRAVVLRGCEVLVVRDPDGLHITPGGRREPGESLEETLRREVLEETGWTVEETHLLGFGRFRHLGPEPPGYRYPYPVFLHLVYVARAGSYLPEAREKDGYELASGFFPIERVRMLSLRATQRVFLLAAYGQAARGLV